MRLVRMLFLLLIFLAAIPFAASADCCLEEIVQTRRRQVGAIITFSFRASCQDVRNAVLEANPNCVEDEPCDDGFVDGEGYVNSDTREDHVIVTRRQWQPTDSSGNCPDSVSNPPDGPDIIYTKVETGQGGDLPYCELDFYGSFGSVTVTGLNESQLKLCLGCIRCLLEPLVITDLIVQIVSQYLEDLIEAAAQSAEPGIGGTWHSGTMPPCPY